MLPPAIASNRRHRHTLMRPTSCSSHLLLPVPLRRNTANQHNIPLREKGQEEVAWTGLRSKERRREHKGKGPIEFTVVLYRPRYQKTTDTRISAKHKLQPPKVLRERGMGKTHGLEAEMPCVHRKSRFSQPRENKQLEMEMNKGVRMEGWERTRTNERDSHA